jgi:hypothetical protein
VVSEKDLIDKLQATSNPQICQAAHYLRSKAKSSATFTEHGTIFLQSTIFPQKNVYKPDFEIDLKRLSSDDDYFLEINSKLKGQPTGYLVDSEFSLESWHFQGKSPKKVGSYGKPMYFSNMYLEEFYVDDLCPDDIKDLYNMNCYLIPGSQLEADPMKKFFSTPSESPISEEQMFDAVYHLLNQQGGLMSCYDPPTPGDFVLEPFNASAGIGGDLEGFAKNKGEIDNVTLKAASKLEKFIWQSSEPVINNTTMSIKDRPKRQMNVEGDKQLLCRQTINQDPIASTLEAPWASAIENAIKSHPLNSIHLGTTPSYKRANKISYEYFGAKQFIEGDFSKFEAKIRTAIAVMSYVLVFSFCRMSFAHKVKWTTYHSSNFIKKHIVTHNNNLFLGGKGNPSGCRFNSVINSVICLICLYMVILNSPVFLDNRYAHPIVQGDDFVIMCYRNIKRVKKRLPQDFQRILSMDVEIIVSSIHPYVHGKVSSLMVPSFLKTIFVEVNGRTFPSIRRDDLHSRLLYPQLTMKSFEARENFAIAQINTHVVLERDISLLSNFVCFVLKNGRRKPKHIISRQISGIKERILNYNTSVVNAPEVVPPRPPFKRIRSGLTSRYSQNFKKFKFDNLSADRLSDCWLADNVRGYGRNVDFRVFINWCLLQSNFSGDLRRLNSLNRQRITRKLLKKRLDLSFFRKATKCLDLRYQFGPI